MSLEPSGRSAIGRGVQYEYYMVQIPSNFAAQQNKTSGHEIASYVQDWANRLASCNTLSTLQS